MSAISEHVFKAGPHKSSEDIHRAHAVAAALEAIAAYAASNSAVSLEAEMQSLSKYADHIQAALKAN